ncbi:MAG: ROK family protein [Mycobacteriales bacterium]
MDVATSARQASLRAANLGLVLRTLCGSASALSRADLAARTGMTRATAARLVDELVEAGLADELERSAEGRRGRPATPLRPGGSVAALGLQIDVTYLAARVINLRGEVVAERVEQADLVDSDPRPVLARLRQLARQASKDVPAGSQLIGAGLALPGIVDSQRGVLLRAPNLGWEELRIGSALGQPVRVGNEADLAALTVAQTAPGRSSELQDFLYVSGNVGVGGAAVLAGRIMTGSHGRGGEIGHVCVDASGPRCGCGARGCLEQYAGQHALLQAAGLPPTSPVELVAVRANDGDPRAQQALTAAVSALGIALGGVINVLDISTVVLGGHLGVLSPGLEQQLEARVLSSQWGRPRVLVAPTTSAPAATGAALHCLTELLQQPGRWLAGAA